MGQIREEAEDEAKTGRGRKGRWISYDKQGNKTQHDMKSATDIFDLANIPGFGLTERAKKAMKKIAQNRMDNMRKSKEDADGDKG